MNLRMGKQDISDCIVKDFGCNLQHLEQHDSPLKGQLIDVSRNQKSQKLWGALVAGSVIAPCSEP